MPSISLFLFPTRFRRGKLFRVLHIYIYIYCDYVSGYLLYLMDFMLWIVVPGQLLEAGCLLIGFFVGNCISVIAFTCLMSTRLWTLPPELPLLCPSRPSYSFAISRHSSQYLHLSFFEKCFAICIGWTIEWSQFERSWWNLRKRNEYWTPLLFLVYLCLLAFCCLIPFVMSYWLQIYSSKWLVEAKCIFSLSTCLKMWLFLCAEFLTLFNFNVQRARNTWNSGFLPSRTSDI